MAGLVGVRQRAALDADPVADRVEVRLQALQPADEVHQDVALGVAHPVERVGQPEVVGRVAAAAAEDLVRQSALVVDEQPLQEGVEIRFVLHRPREDVPLAALVVVVEGHHLVPGIADDGELEVLGRIAALAFQQPQVVLDGVVAAGAARQGAAHALAGALVDVHENELVTVVDHGVPGLRPAGRCGMPVYRTPRTQTGGAGLE